MPDATSHRSSRSSRKTEPKLEFQDAPQNPIAEKAARPQRARDYEQKTADTLGQITRALASSPNTAPDAAALLLHGPAFASKLGDLADADDRVRRAIDMVTSGTENPYLAMGIATLPLVAQLLRNHETGDVTKRVEIRIPFTKRTFKLPFKLRITNPVIRSMTVEPRQLAAHTFSQPQIVNALSGQGVDLSWLNGKADSE